MKKIEAIVRPEKLDILIDRLENAGVTGLNVINVKGYGSQKGHTEVYRGVTYNIKLREKIRIETVIPDDLASQVVDTITETAKTGEVGDGKIFVSNVENAVRIRTGETGQEAL
ncbi:MAG: P-II family nitrogen regulator [Bacillota bacterium]